MQWTEKQLKVIQTRDRSILVSAAAGSGKTAVLVERIIRLITDPENQTDIDELLVVTFTRAAALEMKERIREALEEMSLKNPDDANVQKQLSFLHNANISTIDSFCSNVVRENFDKIDLDPNFRIADETEIEMLKADIIEEMLEEYYENGEEDFIRLAKQYSSGKITDNIGKLIDQLYRYASGWHNPEQWVKNCIKYYEPDSYEAFENSSWMKIFLELVGKQLRGYVDALKMAVAIAKSENMEKHQKILEQMVGDISRVAECDNYDRMRKTLMAIEFSNLPREKECDPQKKEQIASIKKEVTEAIRKMKNGMFSQTGRELYKDIIKSADSVKSIVRLTLDFMERFSREKNEKGIMDFNDQEHYALKILNEEDERGNLIPSDTARQMSRQFKEIMIDEYQDSNFVQEAILSSVSKGQGINNMFMVGDVKQSIYRFRQAQPKLFLDKYERFCEDLNQPECKIVLDQNFRSRREIIDSVNYIFDYIMYKQVGGIDYKDGNQLVAGARYEESPKGQDNSTEFIIIEGREKKIEAEDVAAQIKKITDPINGMKITEPGKGMRPVTYGDIAILLRSVKGNGEIYIEQLEKHGIPAYAESRTGYYQAMEVRTIISMLSIIDNPRQDIPLAATMVSPMFRFTEEEMAQIKAENECSVFYDNVERYAENGRDKKLRDKICSFLALLDDFREKVPYTSVYDLINELLETTGYSYYIRAMVNGDRRYLNIEALKEKAVAYDAISYKGLFNFIRYIEKLNYLSKDDGEASVTSENDNIVHIMSIHKSKGLQFPIVFLCNTSALSKTDREYIVAGENGIIGLDYIDYELKIKEPTLIKKMIRMENNEEDRAETLRILYVALTRAKEKLFITGLTGNLEKTLSEYGRTSYENSPYMSYNDIIGNKSFMDWIGKAVGKNRVFHSVSGDEKFDKIWKGGIYDKKSSIRVSIVREEEIVFEKYKETIKDDIQREALTRLEHPVFENKVAQAWLEKCFHFTYPFLEDVHLHSKTSVTELKRQDMAYDEEQDGQTLYEKPQKTGQIVPQFLKNDTEKVLTSTEKGTAYHRVFELLDMEKEISDLSEVSEMADLLVASGKIASAQMEAVDMQDILQFTKSSLYARMKKAHQAGQLYRERKFLMGVSANKIHPESSSEETMIIQGMIDVCFLENGKYVIADYKTDRINNMEQLADRYCIQLECYKKAIEQISGMEVSEMILYSVYLGKEMIIEKGGNRHIL